MQRKLIEKDIIEIKDIFKKHNEGVEETTIKKIGIKFGYCSDVSFRHAIAKTLGLKIKTRTKYELL